MRAKDQEEGWQIIQLLCIILIAHCISLSHPTMGGVGGQNPKQKGESKPKCFMADLFVTLSKLF